MLQKHQIQEILKHIQIKDHETNANYRPNLKVHVSEVAICWLTFVDTKEEIWVLEYQEKTPLLCVPSQ